MFLKIFNGLIISNINSMDTDPSKAATLVQKTIVDFVPGLKKLFYL
jgi:hypothetical protein